MLRPLLVPLLRWSPHSVESLQKYVTTCREQTIQRMTNRWSQWKEIRNMSVFKHVQVGVYLYKIICNNVELPCWFAIVIEITDDNPSGRSIRNYQKFWFLEHQTHIRSWNQTLTEKCENILEWQGLSPSTQFQIFCTQITS